MHSYRVECPVPVHRARRPGRSSPLGTKKLPVRDLEVLEIRNKNNAIKLEERVLQHC